MSIIYLRWVRIKIFVSVTWKYLPSITRLLSPRCWHFIEKNRLHCMLITPSHLRSTTQLLTLVCPSCFLIILKPLHHFLTTLSWSFPHYLLAVRLILLGVNIITLLEWTLCFSRSRYRSEISLDQNLCKLQFCFICPPKFLYSYFYYNDHFMIVL